jgi:hypothetical protein
MNPRDVLHYGQAEIDRLIDRCSPDAWQAVALGVWTTKDVVGHLGAFEVRFRDVLAMFLGEPPATDILHSPVATFNDDQAAIRHDWPVSAVVAELRDAHRGVMALVDRISTSRWSEVGTIPWYGPQYALDDLAVYTMYGHKREHAPQVEAAIERFVA